mgnify:CR=1 FL=1
MGPEQERQQDDAGRTEGMRSERVFQVVAA